MSIGLMREEDLMLATASGPGNLLLLIGSTTGRDGIGGASTLASQEFDEKAEDKRPSVQVGDPFEEKLLIEACLELLAGKLLVALGDLGAAGLTSSASEMASRGGVGLDIDVTKVPQREENMLPFEIMVSESQERMLAVAEPDNLAAAQAVCEKWGLRCTVIGTVTDTGRFIVREGDTVVADMPAATLADDAPIYEPEKTRPAYLDASQAFDVHSVTFPQSEQLGDMLLTMLATPDLCSRRWIWEQYDHEVMLNTVVLPGSDAAVLRIKGTSRGIAVSTDCNGRYCYLDPYTGAQLAFVEAARNVACSGARPIAITDCLNFGNPEKPEVFWTFDAAVHGLADACTVFGVPVISGNVSFYNESFGQPIYPTPTVGLVGLLEDVTRHVTSAFADAGDAVLLLGTTRDELGGSELLKLVTGGTVAGMPPAVDLAAERALGEALVQAAEAGIAKSAHDCAEGGLGVALAECCIQGGVGASVALQDALSAAVSLFSESQGRVIVTCAPSDVPAFLCIARGLDVPAAVIGEVGGDELSVAGALWVPVQRLADAFDPALERLVHGGQSV